MFNDFLYFFTFVEKIGFEADLAIEKGQETVVLQ